jgi:hypothetical protein
VYACRRFVHKHDKKHAAVSPSCTAVSNFKPRCKGWPVYEALILKAAALYNITNVYLATDDDAIVAAAGATQERSGGKLKFFFANIDREGLFASSWFLECGFKFLFFFVAFCILNLLYVQFNL